jgi:prevent-host-death family protein
MNVATAIEPITVLKANSARLIKRVQVSGQPIVITQNGQATAVLQDVQTYEEQRRTLHLLKFLVQGDQELKRGAGIPQASAQKHFAETLKGLTNA